MLGDLLTKLTDETAAIDTILGTGDLTLLAAVKEKAMVEKLDLAACIVQTVQRYTHEANDEEWVTLIGLMNRTNDPSAVCLKRAFEYARRG